MVFEFCLQFFLLRGFKQAMSCLLRPWKRLGLLHSKPRSFSSRLDPFVIRRKVNTLSIGFKSDLEQGNLKYESYHARLIPQAYSPKKRRGGIFSTESIKEEEKRNKGKENRENHTIGTSITHSKLP